MPSRVTEAEHTPGYMRDALRAAAASVAITPSDQVLPNLVGVQGREQAWRTVKS